ncbi:TlpA family protein disulfide reductase [bacterium]|nr:TlpA family protein disulfide reductase [bacterium]
MGNIIGAILFGLGSWSVFFPFLDDGDGGGGFSSFGAEEVAPDFVGEMSPPPVDLEVLGAQDEWMAAVGRLEEGVWSPVTVVNFWASWCGPCLDEMPDFVRVSQDWEACAVEKSPPSCPRLIGIATWDEREDALDTMEEFGMEFINLFDEGDLVSDAWMVNGIPTTFFLDGEGVVVRYITGSMTEEELRSIAQEVMDGNLLPAVDWESYKMEGGE